MVLINPFCPISAAKIVGLKTTVVLLLMLLMKSNFCASKCPFWALSGVRHGGVLPAHHRSINRDHRRSRCLTPPCKTEQLSHAESTPFFSGLALASLGVSGLAGGGLLWNFQGRTLGLGSTVTA